MGGKGYLARQGEGVRQLGVGMFYLGIDSLGLTVDLQDFGLRGTVDLEDKLLINGGYGWT